MSSTAAFNSKRDQAFQFLDPDAVPPGGEVVTDHLVIFQVMRAMAVARAKVEANLAFIEAFGPAQGRTRLFQRVPTVEAVMQFVEFFAFIGQDDDPPQAMGDPQYTEVTDAAKIATVEKLYTEWRVESERLLKLTRQRRPGQVLVKVTLPSDSESSQSPQDLN